MALDLAESQRSSAGRVLVKARTLLKARAVSKLLINPGLTDHEAFGPDMDDNGFSDKCLKGRLFR